MKIIDISAAGQRDANLAVAFQNGISAAIFRMGYGRDKTSQDDKEFEENVRKCEECNKPWGAYLFSYAIDEDHVRSEIAHAKRLMKGRNPQLGVWYDIEQGPVNDYKLRKGFLDYEHGDELTRWAHMFIDAMTDEGYTAGLYCDYYHATRIIDVCNIKHLWIANYKTDASIDNPPMKCDLWQYTSTEAVAGVDETTDVNYVYAKWMKDIINKSDKKDGSCVYQVFTNNRWLPCVTGYDNNDFYNGYAGIPNKPISGFAAHAPGCTLCMKAHLLRQNRWLPTVCIHDVNDVDGYAGILGKEIDGLQIWTEDGIEVEYQVSTIEHGFYPAVYGSRHSDEDIVNGFAGAPGEKIDRVLCRLL